MKISVVGSGYVGLVSGACLSDVGHIVTCVDNNKEKIEMLNSGEMPIFEKGLKELVQNNVEDGRLFFTTDIKKQQKMLRLFSLLWELPRMTMVLQTFNMYLQLQRILEIT